MGDHAPEIVTCYIEIVPTDSVKHEIEKTTGYLKIDRPQRFSSFAPCLYGLIPRTYCDTRVAAFSAEKANRFAIEGDHDPLDVCVFTEKTITHGDLLLEAIPIGGLRMLDGSEADDKIIAVLKGDALFGVTTPNVKNCTLRNWDRSFEAAKGRRGLKVPVRRRPAACQV